MIDSFFSRGKNVLVLGSDGMLGTELFERLKRDSVIRGSGINYVYGMNRDEMTKLDVLNFVGLRLFLRRNRRFDVCVNCVAMTDTKAAESTAAGRDLSYRLNAVVPGELAKACASERVRFVHVSTDYVFSEKCNHITNMPFVPSDSPFPVNVYGTHKLLGEKLVREAFMSYGCENMYAILRTSWLYGMSGGKSFVHKFVRNAVAEASQGHTVEVTENEVSVPTPVEFLSEVISKCFVGSWSSGLFHAVPCGRPISRREWAEEIISSMLKFIPERNDSLSDRIIGTMTGCKFIEGVVRNGMLNPEYSAMSPSNFKKVMNICHVEWLERFMQKNATAIYADALSLCGK